MTLDVDYERCMHCGACVGTCPNNALFLREYILEVDDNCSQCGLCVKVCPLGALDLEG